MSAFGRRYGSLSIGLDAAVAYQRWGAEGGAHSHRVLALHGWLDNSNSFAHIGPFLASKGYEVVAIDIPGHGLSTHLFPGTHFFPYCVDTLKLVIDELGWSSSPSNIIGHSMGAGISMLFTGVFPDLVRKCVLIDQVAPLMQPASSAAEKLRASIEGRHALLAKAQKPKEYGSLQDTINARLRAVQTYPGSQTLSPEAALTIMHRGVVTASNPQDATDTGGDRCSEFAANQEGPVVFRHDPKLMLSSYVYFSPEQALSFAERITAPVYLIEGTTGWPMASEANQAIKTRLAEKGVLRHDTLQGAHHLHLDPDSADVVATHIHEFLLL